MFIYCCGDWQLYLLHRSNFYMYDEGDKVDDWACPDAPRKCGKNSASEKQKNERSFQGRAGEPADFVLDVHIPWWLSCNKLVTEVIRPEPANSCNRPNQTAGHSIITQWNTGRFANESVRQRPVRQRMKSIRQRRMSVRQRLYASYFGLANVQNTFSFDSAVDERTTKKLYGVKCWVHIFSGLFGSAVDKRTRNNWCACKGKKWPCIFCSLAALANWHSTLANRLHTLANWSLANWLVGEMTGYHTVCK